MKSETKLAKLSAFHATPVRFYVIQCGAFIRVGSTVDLESRMNSHFWYPQGWTPFGRGALLGELDVHVWGSISTIRKFEIDFHKRHIDRQLRSDTTYNGPMSKFSEWYPAEGEPFESLRKMKWQPLLRVPRKPWSNVPAPDAKLWGLQ